jgi:putative endopeptidase
MEIATQIRDALGRGIDRNTWMSPGAKNEAKAKLAKLKIEVGAPSRDLDYTVQPMGRGSFGGNMLIASTWRHREEMRRIGRGNADRRWDVLPQQPALAYDIAHNRLIVTAAMLQAPVLDATQDTAAQYGAFGALVGHELTHGFDTNGRMVDAAGAVRDWWSPTDAAGWETHTSPLVAQYGTYAWPGLTGMKVDGRRTRDENAADLAGVELALDALAAAQPALTPEGKQAFFKGWAQLWPQQLSSDIALRMSASNVHAPGQWRTNGPLADTPAFGDAFKCKAGTPMQRASGEQVSIWR